MSKSIWDDLTPKPRVGNIDYDIDGKRLGKQERPWMMATHDGEYFFPTHAEAIAYADKITREGALA